MMETEAEAAEVLVNALQLARERVTAGTIAEKQARRDRLRNAIHRVHLAQDGDGSQRPDAGELCKLLGDPDDREIRRALEIWG